jgi:hypothetical protein
LPLYRYRTSALTGPWRHTADEALRDAVNAKQAALDPERAASVRWIVPGSVEEMNEDDPPERAEG